ncbi:antibiotic biosynthesis monooxygenase family protein [Delftia lacustris]|jgi:heme-degrading monooxygenase HmoA
MSSYLSVLMLKSTPGRLDEAMVQFKARQVLQTCSDAVPGFISGRLLRSLDEADRACVICEWVDQAAFEQWMSSPRRNADVPEKLFEPSGRSALFELVQQFQR